MYRPVGHPPPPLVIVLKLIIGPLSYLTLKDGEPVERIQRVTFDQGRISSGGMFLPDKLSRRNSRVGTMKYGPIVRMAHHGYDDVTSPPGGSDDQGYDR